MDSSAKSLGIPFEKDRTVLLPERASCDVLGVAEANSKVRQLLITKELQLLNRVTVRGPRLNLCENERHQHGLIALLRV